MRRLCSAVAICFLLFITLARAEENKKVRVTVIENVPMTSSYNWEVEGEDSISCYSTGCTSHFTFPDSGTASVNGATLKLLLADGRIVIAQCVAKTDIRANVANALADNGASSMYRSCRRPGANDTVYATFKHSQVKLFMQAPSLDGTGAITSETYYIVGVLEPSSAHLDSPKTSVSPESIHQQLSQYSYPQDGFIASFPSEPQITKGVCPAGAEQAESHMYSVQSPSLGLLVSVCDYGIAVIGVEPDSLLRDRMNDSLTRTKFQLLSEKNITYDTYHGIEFEAENSLGHFVERIYLVDSTLYKVAVITLKDKPYPDTTRFLDGFELLEPPKIVGDR